MRQRYMVGVDGTAFAEQALSYPIALLKPDDELLLVRVGEPQRDERGELERYLSRLQERLQRALPVTPRTLVVYGEPWEELPRLAREEAVNLLVMSTHSRTGLKRWLLGSVAEAVARLAPCPVWLTPAREQPLQLLEEPWDTPRGPLAKLLVPLDTSELADRALEFVHSWPPARWAHLVLLAATDMRPPNRKVNSKLREYLHRSLEERATPLCRAGWAVQTRVVDDLAYESIVRVARSEHFDAVVMATHGRTGVDRYLTGSLAESVARRCGCPTVVIPPGARVPASAGAPR